MKHLFKILLLIFSLLIIYNPLNSVKAETFSTEEMMTKTKDDLLGYKKNNDMDIYEYFNNELEVVINNNTLNFNGTLIDYGYANQNIYYLLIFSDDLTLYKIQNNKITKEYHFPISLTIHKMYINDKLYLLSKNHDQAVIIELDKDLSNKKEYELGVDFDTNLIDMKESNDYYYLIATRLGHSENPKFKNVGNYNETKTLIYKLDKRLNIIDICYFNNYEVREIPIFLDILNNQLFLVIQTPNNYIGYTSDLSFKTIKEAFNINNDCEYEKILIGENLDFLLFDYDDHLTLTTKNELLDLTISHILDLDILNHELVVYYKDHNHMMKSTIWEYHINQLDNFYIGYNIGHYDFEEDLNHTDAINIESYFNEVKVFSVNDVDLKTMENQELSLLIKLNDQKVSELNTQLIFIPYINLIDNYCYDSGKTLNFIGQCYLDDQLLPYGSSNSVDSEGWHKVKLQVGEEVFHYQFYIKNNYYMKNDLQYDYDMTVKKEEDAIIYFSLEENQLASEVYVNNKSIAFKQEGNIISFKIPASVRYQVDKYILNKIVIDNISYEMNQEIKLLTLKKTPTLNIKEENQDHLCLDIIVTDTDQTFLYLVLKNNDEIIDYQFGEKKTYHFDKTYDKLALYALYDLGDGIIREMMIMEINGEYKAPKDLLTIDVNIDNSLKQIKVEWNTQDYENIDKITIAKEVVNYDYQNNYNYTNIIISMVLSIVIIITVIMLIIIKMRKTKERKKSPEDLKTNA